SSASASIPNGLSVSAGGALTLSAGNDTDASATADGSAVSKAKGSAGSNAIVIGAAVALNVADASNLATIGKSTTISAKGITVAAGESGLGDKDSTDTFSAQATSGA